MEGQKETIAGAYVAPDQGAAVPYFGPIGTRQSALDTCSRNMPAPAQHLLLLYEVGPCGSWLYRSLQQQDDDCWGVAPSR